jgi:hypothetical protein
MALAFNFLIRSSKKSQKMAPQLENTWSSYKTLFSALLLIHAVGVNLSLQNFSLKGQFYYREKGNGGHDFRWQLDEVLQKMENVSR